MIFAELKVGERFYLLGESDFENQILVKEDGEAGNSCYTKENPEVHFWISETDEVMPSDLELSCLF